MKTFKQFINESVSIPTEGITGCHAINLVYDFLYQVHNGGKGLGRKPSEKLFIARRVEEIDGEQYLMYVLDKDKFEGISRIPLDAITEKDVTNLNCYREPEDMKGEWLDSQKTRYGIQFLHEAGSNHWDFIFIFVLDKTTRSVSTLEYGTGVERLDTNPKRLFGKHFTDKHRDFYSLLSAFEPRKDPETAKMAEHLNKIQKIYNFFNDVHHSEYNLFIGDRIEKIGRNRKPYLVYKLDKDKFEKQSGITLNDITLDDVKDTNGYYNCKLSCGWIDSPDNTKWGITIITPNNYYTQQTIIFVIDKNTNRVSNLEYATPTDTLHDIHTEEELKELIGKPCPTGMDAANNYCRLFDVWMNHFTALHVFSYKAYASKLGLM